MLYKLILKPFIYNDYVKFKLAKTSSSNCIKFYHPYLK